MKIKLKLNEMFAISRIVDKQPIIGYRAALTKLFHKMLDINEFSKIVEIYEEIKINEASVLKDFEDQRIALSEKAKQHQGKELPSDIQSELNNLNHEVVSKIRNINQQLLDEVNNILSDQTLEFELEFNELLIKSISNIVESEKTAEEYEIEKPIVKFLIDVYIKLQEK